MGKKTNNLRAKNSPNVDFQHRFGPFSSIKNKIQSSQLSCKHNGKMQFTRTVNYIISNANYGRENEQ